MKVDLWCLRAHCELRDCVHAVEACCCSGLSIATPTLTLAVWLQVIVGFGKSRTSDEWESRQDLKIMYSLYYWHLLMLYRSKSSVVASSRIVVL